MLRYLGRHFNLMVLTLFAVSLLSFWLAFLFPGDPVSNLTGLQPGEKDFGSAAAGYSGAQSIIQQYWHYMVNLFSGDWGKGFSTNLPLIEEIAHTLPASIELTSYALFMSLLIGIPLGFLAGFRHKHSSDMGIMAISVTGHSIPVFWLALLFILLFCLQLGWLPLSGRINLLFDVPHYSGFIFIDIMLSDVPNKSSAMYSAFKHLVLPTMSISVLTSAIIIRITRRSVIDVMGSDYIKAAYTKGLTHWQVIRRHAIRNSLLPILPILAMQFTALLTNAMIVESIFSWPGIGNWLIQAIYQRDYPAIRIGMLTVSCLVVIIHMALDVFIRILDPTKDKDENGTD